jgi:hypothetical protein
MGIFKQLAEVRAARTAMTLAREQAAIPAAALLARAQAHPLTSVGIAAGAGVAMGSLDVHPLRIPGLGTLISGGLTDVLMQVTGLAAGLGAERSDAA